MEEEHINSKGTILPSPLGQYLVEDRSVFDSLHTKGVFKRGIGFAIFSVVLPTERAWWLSKIHNKLSAYINCTPTPFTQGTYSQLHNHRASIQSPASLCHLIQTQRQILIIWGSPWTTTILFLVLYLFVREKKVFNGFLAPAFVPAGCRCTIGGGEWCGLTLLLECKATPRFKTISNKIL
jgi:hypothetical protein